MRMITFKNCAVLINEHDHDADVIIEDYESGKAIKISSREMLNLSQCFWKLYSIAKIKSERVAENLESKSAIVSKEVGKNKYW